jgi:hypothetical protein
MESWNVAVCKHDPDADFYLMNRDRTPIKFTTKVPFNMGEFLSALENLDFPLKYTDGLEMIRFRRLKNYYGQYGGDVIDMGAKPKRSMKMYIETFIHEVAHHIDSDDDVSGLLTDERKKKGKYVGHFTAEEDDSEYFARGFERFYSLDPNDKKNLRKKCPKLYRAIQKLHKKYSNK